MQIKIICSYFVRMVDCEMKRKYLAKQCAVALTAALIFGTAGDIITYVRSLKQYRDTVRSEIALFCRPSVTAFIFVFLQEILWKKKYYLKL